VGHIGRRPWHAARADDRLSLVTDAQPMRRARPALHRPEIAAVLIFLVVLVVAGFVLLGGR